tara:strand:+ start:29245 stop:29889 length:645 start_codon:yes stop_codon:yes gene_type:complete
MQILFSFLKGAALGSFITFLGFFFDMTFSRKSYKKLLDKSEELLDRAIPAIKFNLMIIGPTVYGFVDYFFLEHNYNIQPVNILGVLGIHSVGYYISHYAMHKSTYLYNLHKFHHEFDKVLIPSIGNAVSKGEFVIAYVTPFVISAYFLRPSEASFLIPVGIISIMNLVIHCKEFENVKWSKLFVSPKNHIMHHEIRNKHFSAPTINIDYLLENI